MWIGVFNGFARLKFSGSFRKNGVIKEILIINSKKINIGRISFEVKYGWNGILSLFGFTPNGLLDPVM
jgi:hypothetical protein